MQLPNAADLVRAFVADLGNVLDVPFPGSKPTVQKTLWGTGAATITADRDYTIIALHPLGALITWVLATTNVTPAQVALANGTIFDNVIGAFETTTVLATPITSLRWFWQSGQKLFFNSSGGCGLLFILEP